MTDETPAIELIALSKRYGESTVLKEYSLEIRRGEFLVLLGPSGCGKSTLLKIIAGLEDVTDGEVYVDGRLVNYVPPKDRDVAMVFQNYALYPHMTVHENLAFPLKMRGHDKAHIRERVASVTRLLDLDDHIKKYPDQLSGGQRQRVALGRAVIREPLAFLMDEPLSNLDALLRVQMRDELLKLHRRVGRTTVYVTHDQFEAMTMADRIVVMNAGVIQQVGTPAEIYGHPANTFVAAFVGSPQMNIYPGKISGERDRVIFAGQGFTVPLPSCRLQPGSEVKLGIRPEDVLLDGEGGHAISGRAALVESVGPDVYLNFGLAGGGECVIRSRAPAPLAEGDEAHLSFPTEHVQLFDAAGRRIDGWLQPRPHERPGTN